MKRFISLLVAVVAGSHLLYAQSLDQGKKYFGYERFTSAKEQFEKLVAANPNDLLATYWLGQTLIELKDTAAAKALYQKALMSNGNAPVLLVGMGHIDLLEGKKAEARQRFELALNLTKHKEIAVMNGIGYAIVKSKDGDANFVIEKLLPFTQQKDFKSPETWIVIGDAYRKLIDGGNAVQSYQKALNIDPKNAAARYRIGKVYLTQGNKDVFLPAFEEAIQMDASFAPAYYELYYYWFYRDINKARELYDKFLAVSDPQASNDYERASIMYASKNYDDAINASKQNISKLGDKADPKYYKLIAYCYNEKGDSASAKSYMEQYFAKQKPEDFVTKDYSFYAQLQGRFAEYDKAYANYQKAIDTDTAVDSKFDLMKEASELARKSGDRTAQANWLGKIYYSKPKPSNRDLYDYGFAYYQAGNYDSSYTLFNRYRDQYPDEIFGYLWSARSMQAIDSTLEKGQAAAEYEKLATAGKRIDSVRFKAQIVQAYGVLASYHNNVKKDKATAISYLQKILEIDPGNTSAQEFINALQKSGTKPPASQPKKTGGGTSPGSAPSPVPRK